MLETPLGSIPMKQPVLRVDVAVEGTAHCADHYHMLCLALWLAFGAASPHTQPAFVGIVDMCADDQRLLNASQRLGQRGVAHHPAHPLTRVAWAAVNDAHGSSPR